MALTPGEDVNIPIFWWLQLFSLGLTLAGTAFVGVLYARKIANALTKANLCNAKNFSTSTIRTLPAQLMPSDDTRIYVGDRLLVLAKFTSLPLSATN